MVTNVPQVQVIVKSSTVPWRGDEILSVPLWGPQNGVKAIVSDVLSQVPLLLVPIPHARKQAVGFAALSAIFIPVIQQVGKTAVIIQLPDLSHGGPHALAKVVHPPAAVGVMLKH